MLHPSRVGCRNLKFRLLTRLGEHCRYPLGELFQDSKLLDEWKHDCLAVRIYSLFASNSETPNSTQRERMKTRYYHRFCHTWLALTSTAFFAISCCVIVIMCLDVCANPMLDAAQRMPCFGWTVFGLATISGVAAGINRFKSQGDLQSERPNCG